MLPKFVLPFILAILALNSFQSMAEVGVWTAISSPNNDDFLVWAANFAVSEQNKKVNTSLKFECILSAQVKQIDEGYPPALNFMTDAMYELVILAHNCSGIEKQYKADLIVDPGPIDPKDGTSLDSFIELDAELS
ncbi:cysteine proteinase inhibitor [Striga asiatica]|uniref:Cysteine proteinase inhibitor n=1 Tax=Striga asiatica TaxID=4170 RepID=A0A5A7RGM8_STRAF|nr:cysteine proteinase inhibitor [Striga asiatica]